MADMAHDSMTAVYYTSPITAPESGSLTAGVPQGVRRTSQQLNPIVLVIVCARSNICLIEHAREVAMNFATSQFAQWIYGEVHSLGSRSRCRLGGGSGW